MLEKWLPVPDYDLYEVSDLGRVRSLDRYVPHYLAGSVLKRGRILRPALRGPAHRKYLAVCLYRDGEKKSIQVHRLVLLAFAGECPPGMVACHYDDDYMNNRLDNLRWDTRYANELDKLRNGGFTPLNLPHLPKRTHCQRGHEFTAANTITSHGKRRCRKCDNARHRAYRLARRLAVAA